MAEYIASLEEFSRMKTLCHSLVKTDKTIPDMVFKRVFDFYRFADVNMLFTLRGPQWSQILTLAGKPDAGRVVFLVLNPDPESYYSWCNRYGAVLGDPRAEKEAILRTLSESPKEGTADAICVVANRFVVFSEYSPNWCLWADRQYGIAILGINDCSARQIEELLSDGWFSTRQAIDELLSVSFWPKRIPDDFRWEFLSNYE